MAWKLITRRLEVEAEVLYIGSNTVPTMNLIIVSVTTAMGGNPVTGLTKKDFRVVNYDPTKGHAHPVAIGSFVELKDELNGPHGLAGVYKLEPLDETYLVDQVGETVYAVDVVRVAGWGLVDYGQTVTSGSITRHPDDLLVALNAMINP